ncbi:MAG: IclR family transcriptional regulator [Acetobacteraceae bacterium]|nr:IclR family transcriptional regulator [Acetobacteraceae bacterium]
MRNDGPPRGPYLLGSLRKGLKVLDRFAHRQSWSLAALSAELGQSKPTVFRILRTLEEFGYLTKDAATGRDVPGLRLLGLAGAAVRHEQLRWQALAPLQDLARKTGETVHVGVLHGTEAVCVQAVEDTRLARMHAFVGERTPAHASALGKMLLAHRTEAELQALYEGRDLPRFTPRTISILPALEAALRRIREQGYALDEEEMEIGLGCIGAPIFDHAGRAHG